MESPDTKINRPISWGTVRTKHFNTLTTRGSQHWNTLTRPSTGTLRRGVQQRSIKVVIVGDGMVGKTCMAQCYSSNGQPPDETYGATIYDNYDVTTRIDDRLVKFSIHDTAGQAEYDETRPLCYLHTDVFLVCFALDDHRTFASVSNKWIPEIQHHQPDVPFLLIGTKSDKRRKSDKKMKGIGSTASRSSARKQHSRDPSFDLFLISTEVKEVKQNAARKLTRTAGAHGYMECTAFDFQSVESVFTEAATVVLDPRPVAQPPKPPKCPMLCCCKPQRVNE